MRIRRNILKRHVQFLLTAVLIIACAGIGIFMILKYKNIYKGLAVESEEKIDSMKKWVLAAADDIKRGDMITEESVYHKELIISEESGMWLDKLQINQKAGVNIPKDMPISKNMIFSITHENEGLREVYIDEVNITPNIKPNDFCDIRIIYPNGESYVILSKKEIYNLNEAYNAFCMMLNQEEYHLFLSGKTDCRNFDGSYLFITKYVDLDEAASSINYQPTSQSLSLIISESKNGVLLGGKYSSDERKKLVERLINYKNEE